MKKYNWSNKYISIMLLIGSLTLLVQISILVFTESTTAIYHCIFWAMWVLFFLGIFIIRLYDHIKDKKNIIKTILLFLFIGSMVSCGYETPKLNDTENPFIVEKINQVNLTHSKYYGNDNLAGGGYNFFGSWTPVIMLPTGMYNIGDTIIINNK